MKVGDLVVRKTHEIPEWSLRTAQEQKERLGPGVVLARQRSGQPSHPCATVFYPKTGQIFEIAESLIEVISESNAV